MLLGWGGIRNWFPNYVTTTECVGCAVLNLTKRGFPNPVLENREERYGSSGRNSSVFELIWMVDKTY